MVGRSCLGPPCRRAARDRPDHEAGDCIDDDSNEKERETDLDESAEVEIAGCLREFVGDDACQRMPRCEEAPADLGVIADDHGDCHGLAQSAAQTEHDGSNDADARVAENTNADHLPLGGSEGKDGLALAVGHCHHDVAGQRRDDGQDHDGENDAGGQQAYSEVRAQEEACPAEGLDEEGAENVAHDRDEYKDSPEAVDHAGDGGEEFGEEGDGGAQGLRAEFGDEHSYSQRKGNCQDKGEERGYQCSVDKRKSAEVARDGVPSLTDKKPPAELNDAQVRANDKDNEDEENDDEDAAGAQQHGGGEAVIGQTTAAALAEVFPDGRECGIAGWRPRVVRRWGRLYLNRSRQRQDRPGFWLVCHTFEGHNAIPCESGSRG